MMQISCVCIGEYLNNSDKCQAKVEAWIGGVVSQRMREDTDTGYIV